MSKGGRIAFWISFPIITVFTVFLLTFWLDIAKVPLFVIILHIVFIATYIPIRVFLRNKKFFVRALPTICLVAAILITNLANSPVVERKSIAYYSNPTPTEVLHLANGDVRGVCNEDQSVQMYAGIPYAKAPIGELRWKEPQDVENWEGVLDASYFQSKSMQDKDNYVIDSVLAMYAEKGWHPDFKERRSEPMSEDSLYLNIWRPNNDKKNLPILFFIHGGSLKSGSSSFEDYNGEEVAKKDVIMITITYRLGIFGYFAHPSLKEESPNHTTGNYGLLDQIKALEWVNKNASYIGGDKNNITIAGESAGSSSVSAICSSPLAKGLFKRAIGESSSLVLKTPPHTYRTYQDAVDMGEKIMKEFNCKNIADMRKLSASELMKTQYLNTSMTLDGYALTMNPYEVYLAKENNEEALLNGFNVLEGDAFVIPQYLLSPTDKGNIKSRLEEEFGKEFAERIYDSYKDKIEKDAFGAFNEIFSVYWFMHPHYSWTNLAVNNGETVYKYQFTKENGFYGTYHSGEMIYCFGNVKKSPYDYRYNQDDINLSETMLSYWTNFAKCGDPNGENLPTWSTYNSDSRLMELGENIGPIKDRYEVLYKIFDDYIDYRLAHPKSK